MYTRIQNIVFYAIYQNIRNKKGIGIPEYATQQTSLDIKVFITKKCYDKKRGNKQDRLTVKKEVPPGD